MKAIYPILDVVKGLHYSLVSRGGREGGTKNLCGITKSFYQSAKKPGRITLRVKNFSS